MRNISDIIENYLKKVLEMSEDDLVEIKRSEIADKFQCVPSQINYVINTRFTIERGYIVESKRGGGGYIRIIKVQSHDLAHLYETFKNQLNPVLGRLHSGNLSHSGKIPKRMGGGISLRKKIEELKVQLKNSILHEEFEKAAQLRDEIRTIEKKLEESLEGGE